MDNGTTLKVHPILFEFQVPFQPLCKGYVSPDAAASGGAAGRLDLRAYSRRHPGIASYIEGTANATAKKSASHKQLMHLTLMIFLR